MKSYLFPAILLTAIILGGLTGYYLGPVAVWLKPFGDIFLNLIFTAIVPLIFFSVAAAITRAGSLQRLGSVFLNMTLIFLLMSAAAACYALLIVKLFPLGTDVTLMLPAATAVHGNDLAAQLIHMVTVPDFSKLLSHENMLALILFSLLVGIATASAKEHGKPFADFLQAGEAVFMRLFAIIMYYAPVGFFAYFAVIVSELGPKLISSYARITVIYYAACIAYFIIVYSGFAWFAARKQGVKTFWRHVLIPAATAVATCSSAASIPANLAAAKEMKIAPEIYETVIPLGTVLHKDGSIIGGMFKIAFLFGLFHLSFSSMPVILTALGVAILVGTVMGAIPGGGMLGELFILSVYGFPASVIIAIAAISILIDPIATMLNVTGNTLAALWIAGRKREFKR